MPIPVHSGSTAFDENDNLSVSSVTRKLSLINSSSGEYCFSENLIPSGKTNLCSCVIVINPFILIDTLLAVNISEAVSKGDLDGLNLILQNLNTTPKQFTSPYGNLLHISASLSKFEDFKKILHWSGIDINSQNPIDGSITLHIATKLSRYDIIEYLLSLSEIDDTLKDKEGKTCFDYCKNKSIINLFERKKLTRVNLIFKLFYFRFKKCL